MPGADSFIRIDRDVFERLQELAEPGDSPNTVLRRVLDLAPRPQGRRTSILKPYAAEVAS